MTGDFRSKESMDKQEPLKPGLTTKHNEKIIY
jgi:hypothetical protein